jgi:hypothetical protein
MNSLATGQLVDLSDTLQVYKWTGYGTGDSVAPNSLFIREFYPALLSEIRESHNAILLGNPGIGKSWFQFYYLARILNPDLGTLPPDMDGSCDPPEVIIREVCGKDIQIYFVKEKIAHSFKYDRGQLASFCKMFDPKKSLYLFEPKRVYHEPTETMMPTLATVSPDIRRYKEFQKRGASRIFLPTWSEQELLDAGKHMREVSKRTELYSDEKIHQRFELFGGIFRHVFISKSNQVEDLKVQQNRAIVDVTKTKLLAGDLEKETDVSISHFVCQFDVKRSGDAAFMNPSVDFINSRVREKVKDVWKGFNANELWGMLMREGFQSSKDIILEEYFVTASLGHGIKGKIRPHDSAEFAEFNLKVEAQVVDGHYPSVHEMKSGVMYRSKNVNYPGIDMACKDEDGRVMAFQLTTQSSTITKDVKLKNFFKDTGCDPENVRLILVPYPLRGPDTKWKLNFVQEKLQDYKVLDLCNLYDNRR